MSRQYRWTAALTAGMVIMSSFTSLAAAAPTGPGAGPEQPRYDAETQAKLEDNIIEYSEIPLRVREYNPTMAEIWKQYRDAKEDIEYVVSEMESNYKTVKDTADSYISMGKLMGSNTETGKTMIQSGRQLNSLYGGTLQSMRNQINSWEDDKRTGTMRRYERQIISGVQQAMIGYETICQNIAMLETMVSLTGQKTAPGFALYLTAARGCRV